MLTFQPENKPVKNMTYDENGNLTSMTNSCGMTNYTWDARNRLSSINGFNADCSSLNAKFKYDALGRRIEKSITDTVNGTRTTNYLYDGLDIIQEIKNGTVYANYIRTLNIDEPLARIKSDGTVRYYQQDALGSVIALTDDTSAVKTTYSYDPFGNTTISGEANDNPFQYTGRENDGTGLYYYRARYYSPELQRFISEDPILKPMNLMIINPTTNQIMWFLPHLTSNPKRLHAYAFVGNSPINYIDPYGLLSQRQKCMIACRAAFIYTCWPITFGSAVAGGPLVGMTVGLTCQVSSFMLCFLICPDKPCFPQAPLNPDISITIATGG
jgi:RHS repeat-associated protein